MENMNNMHHLPKLLLQIADMNNAIFFFFFNLQFLQNKKKTYFIN